MPAKGNNRGMLARGYLGDWIESALKSVGITSERVEKWIGRPCNCEERKQKLNALDRWVRRVFTTTNHRESTPINTNENESKEKHKEYLHKLMEEDEKKESPPAKRVTR